MSDAFQARLHSSLSSKFSHLGQHFTLSPMNTITHAENKYAIIVIAVARNTLGKGTLFCELNVMLLLLSHFRCVRLCATP